MCWMCCTGPTRTCSQGRTKPKLLYRHDKHNEPIKEGPISFVRFESPFTSFSKVYRGHAPLSCRSVSDHRTSTIGLATLNSDSPIAIGLTEISRTKNRLFWLLLCVFFHHIFAVGEFFANFWENSWFFGVHSVSGISVAVDGPADANNVVGVSTVADIPANVGLPLPSAVEILFSLLPFTR